MGGKHGRHHLGRAFQHSGQRCGAQHPLLYRDRRLPDLATVAQSTMAFLDAAGTCLILVKRDPPINPRPESVGASVIHPSQIQILNEEFRPSAEEVEHAGWSVRTTRRWPKGSAPSRSTAR